MNIKAKPLTYLSDANPARNIHALDFPNKVLSENRLGVFLAKVARRRCAASFAHPVINIVTNGAKRQMSRIEARRIVTTMQNFKFPRNVADKQVVGNSMNEIRTKVRLNFAVSSVIYSPRPNKTVVRIAVSNDKGN